MMTHFTSAFRLKRLTHSYTVSDVEYHLNVSNTFSKFNNTVNQNTKSLTMTPTSFLKETFLYLALRAKSICVPNILLWSILCKTVGLPSSTGESERTARRQLHSSTLRCFRGRLCEVAAGRGPLKQSR